MLIAILSYCWARCLVYFVVSERKSDTQPATLVHLNTVIPIEYMRIPSWRRTCTAITICGIHTSHVVWLHFQGWMLANASANCKHRRSPSQLISRLHAAQSFRSARFRNAIINPDTVINFRTCHPGKQAKIWMLIRKHLDGAWRMCECLHEWRSRLLAALISRDPSRTYYLPNPLHEQMSSLQLRTCMLGCLDEKKFQWGKSTRDGDTDPQRELHTRVLYSSRYRDASYEFTEVIMSNMLP